MKNNKTFIDYFAFDIVFILCFPFIISVGIFNAGEAFFKTFKSFYHWVFLGKRNKIDIKLNYLK